MSEQQFLEYVKTFCQKNNINFIIFNGAVAKTVGTNSECSGFFECSERVPATLGIAKDLGANFFEVLAHEFCHANQYLEKSPYWDHCRLSEKDYQYYSIPGIDLRGLETGDLFSMWLDNKVELKSLDLQDLVERTTAVEFDCEKRTIELAKQLNLQIDPVVYAQKANAYLITYYFALKNRIWTTTGKATYMTPEVYSQLPQVIDPAFCKSLPPNIESLISKYCLSKIIHL